ncbi:MAG TPA: DUF3999 domain-containing protein [Acidiferrobacterales bacterium]|nr:DUF3999 domain-containing protein [Acidiferrobacterales bacterium]
MNRLLLTTLLMSTGMAMAGAELPPSPDDFAYGHTLSVSPGAALYQITAPDEIYRYTTRADFGDIRLFNKQNEIVPHSLHHPAVTLETPPTPIKLPFFALRATKDNKPDVLSLQIRTDKHGAVIGVRDGKSASTGKFINAYLLDASKLEQPVSALHLTWTKARDSFVTGVIVDNSNDLTHWTTQVSAATLAELRQGENRLIRDTIELPKNPAKYLRLTWPIGEQGVQLQGVTARLARTAHEPERRWLALSSDKTVDQKPAYVFDTQGRFPVDRLTLVALQPNTVVTATLQSRPDAKVDWRVRYQGVFYNLQVNGVTVTNDPVDILTTTDRYWRLAMKTDNTDHTAPQLQLGWLPDELTFVARGEGPYLLAYGSAAVGPSDQPVDNLLNALDRQNIKVIPAAAAVGTPLTLGGEDRLIPGRATLPWRRLLFWAILIIGVLGLGGMALGLHRQMNKDLQTAKGERIEE